ncbi:MAG TPA: thiol-disulfide oxidoreductase, partial [Maribacter sp.]|nr:thiol-disulfide oxidoreductase [Maribacter sp.]
SSILLWLPEALRNIVYDFIARNRYKWYGKKDNCMIPSEELKSKFI